METTDDRSASKRIHEPSTAPDLGESRSGTDLNARIGRLRQVAESLRLVHAVTAG
jgi:hypothetical protein